MRALRRVRFPPRAGNLPRKGWARAQAGGVAMKISRGIGAFLVIALGLGGSTIAAAAKGSAPSVFAGLLIRWPGGNCGGEAEDPRA